MSDPGHERATARQAVVDAGLDLQLMRATALLALGEDDVADARGWRAEVVAVGAERVRWHFRRPEFRPRELLSVVPVRTVAVMRRSHRRNLALASRGTTMVSVFDIDTIDHGSTSIVRSAGGIDYRFAPATLQTKIVDGAQVFVQGAPRGRDPSLLLLTGPSAVAAARTYWDCVRRFSTPATPPSSEVLSGLSLRQRTVLDLLSAGLTDAAIGTELGVSLRTVRYEVAAILDRLAATTRFAAGYAIGRMGATTGPSD